MSSTQIDLLPAREIRRIPQTEELIGIIAEAARDPHVDAAKMRTLWELKQEIDAQASKQAFYRAMKAVQDEVKPVLRSVENDITHSRYARLEHIDRKIRPVYTKHGFSLTFGARTDTPGTVTITCDCMHQDGYVKPYELPGTLDSTNKAKTGIQAVGSTVTYLRRYLTCLIFNVVLTDDPEDDDGTGEPLTEQQRNKILDLLIACGLEGDNAAPFLKFMGAASVAEIPARDFRKALTALQAKQRKSK